MHQNGQGVAKDEVLARKIHERACQLEDKWCNDFGIAHYDGVGGPRDVRKAKELYARACNADEAAACNNLGRIWRDGVVDDAVNVGEAAELFDKSCKLGNTEGCDLLSKVVASAEEACKRDATDCTNACEKAKELRASGTR